MKIRAARKIVAIDDPSAARETGSTNASTLADLHQAGYPPG
jgi:hypothetical protein